MKKALISSISTPKPMESKSIIIFWLFGTHPVLLRQNSQKSWWQIFPVKKPLAWLCLIYNHCLTRMGTDEHFKVQHTQGNLPLTYLWQPLEPRGVLLGTIKAEWEQGNRGNHGKEFFQGFQKQSLLCQMKKKKFEMWTNMAMWPTINNSKPTKKLQVGFV